VNKAFGWVGDCGNYIEAIVIETLHASAICLNEELFNSGVVVENCAGGDPRCFGDLIQANGGTVLGEGSLGSRYEVCFAFTRLRHPMILGVFLT
jgi:hypothetical protein